MVLRIDLEINVDGASLDELILMKAILKMVDQGYAEEGVETPERVLDKLNTVSTEITVRNKAELQRQLKEAKIRRGALATLSEQRSALDQKIANLEKKLA